MASNPFLLVLLPVFLSLLSFVPFPTVVSQSVVPTQTNSSTTTTPSSSSSSSGVPASICPGLTEFNNDTNNDIPPFATFLDLTFQCVYDTDNPGQAFAYTWVPPTSAIRIQPGNKVAFYSSPPNVYSVQSFREDHVFLVQAEWDATRTSTTGDDDDDDDGISSSSSSSSSSSPPPPPPAFALTITFPPEQLQKIRISGTTAGDAYVVIAPGFTRLTELNATMGEGGLDAIFSPTEGTALSVRLRGEAYGGVRLQMTDNNNNNKTDTVVDSNGTFNDTAADAAGLFILDIENGAGDIYIQGTVLNGTVNAINDFIRSGNVILDGVVLDSVLSTGEGPGMMFSIDCTYVIGNCTPLLDDELLVLVGPDVADTCQFGPGCITQSVSTVNTDDSSGPLLSCSNLNVFECAAPTETPSGAPIEVVLPSNMPSEMVITESDVPTTFPSSGAPKRRRVVVVSPMTDVGVPFWYTILISLIVAIAVLP
jgi:hypothetical protein